VRPELVMVTHGGAATQAVCPAQPMPAQASAACAFRKRNGFRVVTALRAVSAPFRRGTLRPRPVSQRLGRRSTPSAAQRGGHARSACSTGCSTGLTCFP